MGRRAQVPLAPAVGGLFALVLGAMAFGMRAVPPLLLAALVGATGQSPKMARWWSVTGAGFIGVAAATTAMSGPDTPTPVFASDIPFAASLGRLGAAVLLGLVVVLVTAQWRQPYASCNTLTQGDNAPLDEANGVGESADSST